MSERGQNDANPGGRRGHALHAAALRLSRCHTRQADAALRELADPLALRLTEKQRLTTGRLSDRLIRDIEDELRGAILADRARTPDEGLEASLGSAHVPIAAPILGRAKMLPDREIVALALERATMHEAGRRLRAGGGAGDRLAGMVGETGAMSDAAMALLIAESRANLRFEEPRLPPADIPVEIRNRLVWTIAAALRHYAARHHAADPGEWDTTVARAAQDLVARLAGETGLWDAADALATALGAVDAPFLHETFGEGRLALYCALIARSAQIAPDEAWMLVGDPRGIGHALLLRAANVGRDSGAPLVLTLLEALDADSADREGEAWLGVWEVEANTVSAALGHWRHPRAYREALARFGQPSSDEGS